MPRFLWNKSFESRWARYEHKYLAQAATPVLVRGAWGATLGEVGPNCTIR